jgi:hypothetical protein
MYVNNYLDIYRKIPEVEMSKYLGYSLLVTVLILVIGCSSPQRNTSTSQIVPINHVSNFNQYKIELPVQAGTGSPVTFETPSSFPQFPETLQVYKMIRPEITPQYLVDLCQKMDLNGEINEGNKVMSISNGSTSLTIYKSSGGIEYENNSISNPRVKPDLPSNDDAISIARDALSKIGQLPKEIREITCVVGESSEWPISLLVKFNRTIDGKGFAGAGDKCGVRVGDKGEIRQIMVNPIKYEVQETVNIKNADQAFLEMKEEKKYIVSQSTFKVIIDDISIGYWLQPITESQSYIAPVYIFSGNCYDYSGEKITRSYVGQISDERFISFVEAIQTTSGVPIISSLPPSSTSPLTSLALSPATNRAVELSEDIGAYIDSKYGQITYSPLAPGISRQEAIDKIRDALNTRFSIDSKQLPALASVALFNGKTFTQRMVSNLPVWIIVIKDLPAEPFRRLSPTPPSLANVETVQCSAVVDATTGDMIYIGIDSKIP